MKTPFGEVFLFLTDLAWKSRITIPMLVTTAFLIMDLRLQIEVNIQTGQAAADLEDLDDDDSDDEDEDSDERSSDGSSDEDENVNIYMGFQDGEHNQQDNNSTANRWKRSLGLS